LPSSSSPPSLLPALSYFSLALRLLYLIHRVSDAQICWRKLSFIVRLMTTMAVHSPRSGSGNRNCVGEIDSPDSRRSRLPWSFDNANFPVSFSASETVEEEIQTSANKERRETYLKC
ncbi:hypothetical protein PIB30_029000, partial [Stylosanthes scabra]|nr:hypothetical protein [Stylosanthes scabra]